MGFLLAIMIAAVSAQAPDPIRSAALAEHSRPISRDPFSKQGEYPHLVGRKFTYEARCKFDGFSPCSWDYRDGALHAGLFFSDYSDNMSPQSAIKWWKSSDRRGQYIGENSFGATAEVTHHSQKYEGFSATWRPAGDYVLELPLNPDEAKSLSSNLIVRITGEVTKRPDGRTVVCNEVAFSADLASRTSGLSQTCYVEADIDTISFIDGRTNAVIKKWPVPARQ